jgi:hypothetical protein
MGELEVHMFTPLVNFCDMYNDPNYAPGNIARGMFQRASAAAIIFRMAKFANSRDIARTIDSDAVKKEAIFQSLVGDREIVETDEKKKKSGGQKSDTVTEFWKLITSQLKNKLNGDPTAFLAKVFAPIGEDDLASSTADMYNQMLTFCGYGPGRRLNHEESQTKFAKFNYILQTIYKCAEQILVSDAPAAALADALALLCALCAYVDEAQQGTTFVTRMPTGQIAYFVDEVSEMSQRMCSMWSSCALASLSYTMEMNIQMWNSLFEFGQAALPHLSAVEDMKNQWQTMVVDVADHVLQESGRQLAKQCIEQLKQWYQVDTVIAEDWLDQNLKSLLSKIPEQKVDLPKINLAYDPKAGDMMVDHSVYDTDAILYATNQLSSPNLLFQASAEGKNWILTTLTAKAHTIQSFMEAIASIFALLSQDGFLSLSPTSSIIPQLAFNAVTTNCNDVPWDTFAVPSPLEVRLTPFMPDPKYANQEKQDVEAGYGDLSLQLNSYCWVWKYRILEPLRKLPFVYSEAKKSTRQWYWSQRISMKMAQPMSAIYWNLPVPAVYVKNRISRSLLFNESEFLTTISGLDAGHMKVARLDDDGLKATNYFRDAANFIVAQPNGIGSSIVDALSSLFLITLSRVPAMYRKPDTIKVRSMEIKECSGLSDKWKDPDHPYYCDPTVPQYWGAPKRRFLMENMAEIAERYQADEEKLKGLQDRYPLWMRRYTVKEDGTDDNGKPLDDIVVTFYALNMFPAPRRTLRGLYSPTMGSAFMTTFAYDDFVNAKFRVKDSQNAVKWDMTPDELIMNKTGDIKFVSAEGYSPFTVTAAALTIESPLPDDLDDGMADGFSREKLASVQILRKWHPFTKMFEIGMFRKNPVIILMPEDVSAFYNSYSCPPPFQNQVTNAATEQEEYDAGEKKNPQLHPQDTTKVEPANLAGEQFISAEDVKNNMPAAAGTLGIDPSGVAPGSEEARRALDLLGNKAQGSGDPAAPDQAETSTASNDQGAAAVAPADGYAIMPDGSAEPVKKGDVLPVGAKFSRKRPKPEKGHGVPAKESDNEKSSNEG